MDGTRARSSSINLVLIHRTAVSHRASFETVARHVRAYDPGIRTTIVRDRPYHLRRLRFATRPTLVVSPVTLRHFRPWRGAVRQGKELTKSEECAALERAGIAVPRWRRGPAPDLDGFAPYVVVKPEVGMRGMGVKIMRRERARLRVGADRIAQEFVNTGPWPVSYRVTTLFGQRLWSVRYEMDHARDPIPARTGFPRMPDGQSANIVASARGGTVTYNDDEEILRFGEEAHARAFPDFPLLGVDIVREQATGRLFVLEVNASGWAWHFASPAGLSIQATLGRPFESQFDGLRKAARILAEKARALAR